MRHQHHRRLSDISQGHEVRLSHFHLGHHLSGRLTSLGLTPGATIQVLQNFGHGPIIVVVRGTHVALGRGEADQLIVDSSEEE